MMVCKAAGRRWRWQRRSLNVLKSIYINILNRTGLLKSEVVERIERWRHLGTINEDVPIGPVPLRSRVVSSLRRF